MWSNHYAFLCALYSRDNYINHIVEHSRKQSTNDSCELFASFYLLFVLLIICEYCAEHCQDIDQLPKYCKKLFRSERLHKNKKRKLMFVECLVLVIVLSTFSYGLSQLFSCLLSQYHRGLSCLPVYVLPFTLFPSNFCLCVFSLFTSLPVRLRFSFAQPFFLFWYCFYCIVLYHQLAFVTTMVFW